MILIKNKDANSSFLEYTGELQDKYIIISLLAQYRDSVKRITTDKWIIPNEIVPLLEERCTVERFVSPWKDIGKGLKYEPYEYQKETVFFGSEKNSALFLLPTGSGKK